MIYLDQFVISNIAKLLDPAAASHEKVSAEPLWRRLFEQISAVIGLELATFPESEFHSDESFISTDPSYETLRDVYEHLSGGTKFYDHHTIERFQMLPRFERWLDGDVEPERPLSPEHLILGDPHEWRGHMRVSAVRTRTEEELARIVAARRSAHAEIVKVFEAWQKSGMSFEQAFANENAAFARVAIQEYLKYLRREAELTIRFQANPSMTFQDEDLLPPPTAALIGHMVREGMRRDMDLPTALGRVREFLLSAAAQEVPSARLSAMLFAAISRKAALGQKRVPSEGVFADVNAISGLLPYCDAMFLDREMAGLLREEPLRSEVRRYGTRVFSLSDPEESLGYLAEIVASADELHLAIVKEYYGSAPRDPYWNLVVNARKQRERRSKEN